MTSGWNLSLEIHRKLIMSDSSLNYPDMVNLNIISQRSMNMPNLVLQIEEVACKDWLTNKVDRSVTGRIAKQQCAGPLQLPLNNLGAITLDYRGKYGYGHFNWSCPCSRTG